MRVRKSGKAAAPAGDTRVSPIVEVVPTAARALYEVLPSSKLWKLPGSLPRALAAMLGAIVKAQPPDDATDEEVAAFRASCAQAGAHHVRVLPRKRAKKAVVNLLDKAAEPAPRRGIRDVVGEVFAGLAHGDPAAVRVELEAALAAEGI